jgi:hypothetical protein
VLEHQTNPISSDVEFFGDQAEQGNATNITSDSSGFDFNFTVGASMRGKTLADHYRCRRRAT